MLLQRNRLTGIVFGAMTALLLTAIGFYSHYREEQHELRRKSEAMTGGDIKRGERLFISYGCGSCHSIPGVTGSFGKVGPPLQGIGSRAVIGGKLENRPENIMRWIIDPQSITPGTAMPRLGVKTEEARDITAFLYMQS